jgi:hypothetical protein
LGRKLVPDNTPWLLHLDPSGKKASEVSIEPGLQITVIGKNFGNEQNGNMITLNETPVTVHVNRWSSNEIKFLLPTSFKEAKEVFIGVVVGGQMSANALPFKIE